MSTAIETEEAASLRAAALELYAAPFTYDCGYIYDANRRMVADDHGLDATARVRGWGRISYLKDPEQLQDTVGQLIAEALTEFWNKANFVRDHVCMVSQDKNGTCFVCGRNANESKTNTEAQS